MSNIPMIPLRTAHELQNFLQRLMFHTEEGETETAKLLIRQLSMRIAALATAEPVETPQPTP